MDTPGGPVAKNLSASAWDLGSIPGLRFHMPWATKLVHHNYITTRESLSTAQTQSSHE